MKLMKRSGIYKASNVTFDPKECIAISYDWWHFVALIDGVVVFNNYRYSVSTAKHQRKVDRLMQDLGIEIHTTVSIRKSLDDIETWNDLNVACARQAETDAQNAEYARKRRNERAKARRAEKKQVQAKATTQAQPRASNEPERVYGKLTLVVSR